MGTWKIMPREPLHTTIADTLTGNQRRSTLLRGPSGVGKTTLSAALAETLAARGKTIVPIVALAELSSIPLGALAPLLATERFAKLNDSVDRLGAFISLLGASASDYVLFVDDAPLLDDMSAAAMYQLVRVYGVSALLTARDLHPLTGAVARLIREDLVTIHDLDGLSIDDTRTVLHARLGAEVNPSSLQFMHSRTAGNPLFLRELVLAAERAGGIHDGAFGLEVEQSALPAHILASVFEHVAGLSDAALDLVRMMALSQPWPEASILDSEYPALDELSSAGVARRTLHGGVRSVVLNHPLFAEATAATSNDLARADRAKAAGRLAEMEGEQYRLVATCLALESGATPPHTQLTRAASYAHSAGDHTTAVGLASSAVGQGGGFDAALVLAVAHSALGNLPECDDAFQKAHNLAVRPDQRAALIGRQGQHQAYRLGDPAAALAHVTLMADTLDDAGRDLLAPDVAKWQIMAGDVPSDATTPPLSTDPAVAFTHALGAAMFATMNADSPAARQALRTGRSLQLSAEAAVPFAPSLLDLSEFLVLVVEGNADLAEVFAKSCRAAPPVDAAGQWSYALAILLSQNGDTSSAADLATLAVQQLQWRDFTGLLGAAIALRATLLAQLGYIAAARSALQLLSTAQLSDIKVQLQAGEARLWLARNTDAQSRAVSELHEIALTALEFKHSLLAAISLGLVTRAGRADLSAGPLLDAARDTRSPFIEALAAQAEMLRDGRFSAIPSTSVSLTKAGLRAIATDGLIIAEREARRRGSESAALVLWTARRSITPQPTALFQSDDARILTEREQEIAIAASRRERNREIAARLGVSVRTVENHLANVYRKLSIAGRDELEDRFRSGQASTFETP